MSKIMPSTADRTRTADQDREPLSGLVERVTYHNAENGYCVLPAVLSMKPSGDAGAVDWIFWRRVSVAAGAGRR